jgi:hypothetical protein
MDATALHTVPASTASRRHRRLALAGGVLTAMLLGIPSMAVGASSYAVSMHLVEPIAPNLHDDDCSLAFGDGGFCGTGLVVPFGRATETIAFGGGCGGSCDRRTLLMARGSLVLDELFTNGECRGACIPNPALPQTGFLEDTVIGGTGMFAGATGALTGQVTGAGHTLPAGESQVFLSGTVLVP